MDVPGQQDASENERETRMERAEDDDLEIEDCDVSFQDVIEEDKFFSQMSMLLNHRPSADRGSSFN